jgi:hypothetical protein
MNSYAGRLARGRQEHGARFDSSDLDAAHPSLVEAYESGQRVRVVTTFDNGETFERTGVVSMTTGWRPAFLLMHRSNARGSWDVLGPRDRVVATWRGRNYVPGTPYGRSVANA